jgi:hypothetical protein
MKPLCTIIIPTIGRPKYFGPALAAAAAQTYRPLEIVVSDNAAQPPIGMEEIRKWAPNAQVRLIRRPARSEAPVHAELCLKEATADYLFWLSDDDLIAPGFVEAGMECMLSDPAVSIVIAKQTQIDEEFLGPVSEGPIAYEIHSGNEYVSHWFHEGTEGLLTTVGLLARRRQMIECGGVPRYPNGVNSDNMMFFRLCLGAKLGLLERGYYYRVYATSSGMDMPWRTLLAGLTQSEADLLKLREEGRLERKTHLAMIRGGTQLLFHRWKTIYRRKPGWENQVQPAMDLAGRILRLGGQHGLGAVPKLHRWQKG